MKFKEYQILAHRTAQYLEEETFPVYIKHRSLTVPTYPFVKIGAEANEIADLYAKRILRGDGIITRMEMIKELGDTLWYVAECSTTLHTTLEYVAQTNIKKLHERLMNNTIHGSGDNR